MILKTEVPALRSPCHLSKVVAIKHQKGFYPYKEFMILFYEDYARELLAMLRCGPFRSSAALASPS